jgi:hypothetical protein
MSFHANIVGMVKRFCWPYWSKISSTLALFSSKYERHIEEKVFRNLIFFAVFIFSSSLETNLIRTRSEIRLSQKRQLTLPPDDNNPTDIWSVSVANRTPDCSTLTEKDFLESKR